MANLVFLICKSISWNLVSCTAGWSLSLLFGCLWWSLIWSYTQILKKYSTAVSYLGVLGAILFKLFAFFWAYLAPCRFWSGVCTYAAAATANIWMFPQSPAKPVRIQCPLHFMKRKHCEAGYFFNSITLVIASLWFTGDKSQGLLFSAYKTTRQGKTGPRSYAKCQTGGW